MHRKMWTVNCMTVISAWWRSNMPFQRRRKCIFRWPVMGRYWVGVELLYNSVQFGDQTSWWQDAVEKTSTQRGWPSSPRLSSPGERERNADGHKSGGSICCSSVRSRTPSHTQPFQIKWEVYFSKNCVARLYCVVVMILHAYEYATVWTCFAVSIFYKIMHNITSASYICIYTYVCLCVCIRIS